MIWPVYVALLSVLFVVLSIRALRVRRRLGVPIGDGGNALMLRAARVHANFAEYAPLGLLLIAGSEVVGAPGYLVHALGLALLAGRLSHAYGVSQEHEVFAFRVAGMVLTFACYFVAAGFILIRALLVGG
ncbi:MAG: MAPEG family protein [Ectothiorhodospiraceae bacterium]|nr:MAPEG family protein [Ectothiorhodospiraceae bacterium]